MRVADKIQRLKLMFDKQFQELNRLSKLPRYTPGSFEWRKSRLSFPDSASFVFTYKEIFVESIYKFESQKPSPFIIDCGANIGLSVIYFKALFQGAKVIAFEPERKIYEYLKDNIRSQDLGNVELVNKAVWKEDAFLMFSNEGADASRISSLGNMAEKKSSYEVEAVRLSKYIDQEVDFLKLDIEGAEGEVIREIEDKLHFVKRIFIEFHSPENGAQELDVILNILTRNKFRYYIDSAFRMRKSPFVDRDTFLSFDFFLNIFAEKHD